MFLVLALIAHRTDRSELGGLIISTHWQPIERLNIHDNLPSGSTVFRILHYLDNGGSIHERSRIYARATVVLFI